MDGSKFVDFLIYSIAASLASLVLGLLAGAASPAGVVAAAEERGFTEVDYWSDVRSATREHAAAPDVIVRHLDDLTSTLTERPRRQQTLRGVVTGIDERNDRLILLLANDTRADFEVQDALVFNAVHEGDRVEITVENIRGAKTIVRLTKQ